MLIKLVEPASWAGKRQKKNSIHDVEDKIAQKLISRGYAQEHTEVAAKEVEEDAPATE